MNITANDFIFGMNIITLIIFTITTIIIFYYLYIDDNKIDLLMNLNEYSLQLINNNKKSIDEIKKNKDI